MRKKHKAKTRNTKQLASADSNVYPLRPKSVAERRDDEDCCPECGAIEGCYACVTSGGWLSRKQHEENERHAAQERSP